MCGNYSFTSNTISKKLDKKTIQKGGLEIVTLPVAKCNLDGERITEIGGYRSIVNYNKHREQENRDIKFQRKMRRLRRNIKLKRLCQCGETIQTGIPRAKDS